MNTIEPDNNGGAGENPNHEADLPKLKLFSLVDKTQTILDPLIIQPGSADLEDRALFNFSKTQWGNSEPIKYQWSDYCEKIVATPCDPTGTTTVQTSHSIAAPKVSGIQKPSRGRFITFDGSIPNQISAVLKNIEGRELGKPHIIYRDNKDSGDYEKITKNLLGIPFPPVLVENLPIELKNLLTKRLKEHDELSPKELKSCIFGPQTKLEKGPYKCVFIFDDDKVKMLYGRAMASKAGKALRPVLNHSHLSGNADLPAGGNFGFGIDRKTREEQFTYIDNGTNGYGYPPLENMQECVKWLIEHEKVEAFRSLDLDVVYSYGEISAFRRKGFSRKSSGQGSEIATPRSEVDTPGSIGDTPGSIGGTPALPLLSGYFVTLADSSKKKKKSATPPISSDDLKTFSDHVAPPDGLELKLPASKVRMKPQRGSNNQKDAASAVEPLSPEQARPTIVAASTEPAQEQGQPPGPAPSAPRQEPRRRSLRAAIATLLRPATPHLLKVLGHAVRNSKEMKDAIARPNEFVHKVTKARGR